MEYNSTVGGQGMTRSGPIVRLTLTQVNAFSGSPDTWQMRPQWLHAENFVIFATGAIKGNFFSQQ